jgi:hypothetical protein
LLDHDREALKALVVRQQLVEMWTMERNAARGLNRVSVASLRSTWVGRNARSTSSITAPGPLRPVAVASLLESNTRCRPYGCLITT